MTKERYRKQKWWIRQFEIKSQVKIYCSNNKKIFVPKRNKKPACARQIFSATNCSSCLVLLCKFTLSHTHSVWRQRIVVQHKFGHKQIQGVDAENWKGKPIKVWRGFFEFQKSVPANRGLLKKSLAKSNSCCPIFE